MTPQLLETPHRQFPSHPLDTQIVYEDGAREGSGHGLSQSTSVFATPGPLLLPKILADAFPQLLSTQV